MEHIKRTVLIRGNSASGKTTLSHMLEKKLGNDVVVISQDTIKKKIGSHAQTAEIIAALVSAVQNNMNKKYILIEGILSSKKYRPFFIWLKTMNTPVKAYYYQLSLAETLRRHKIRACQEFGPEQIRLWYKSADLIGDGFTETIFDENISLENAVNLILRDLQ